MGIFAKFALDDLSATTLIKGSVQRAIRSQLLEQFGEHSEFLLEKLLPKSSSWSLTKGPSDSHVTFLSCNERPAFYQVRSSGPWIPLLRIVQQYPWLLPKVQCDSGAIRYLISGAECMCRGLTSAGGAMDPVEANDVVAIYGNGKSVPLAIGIMTLSSEEVKEKNEGIALKIHQIIHDGLWDNELFIR